MAITDLTKIIQSAVDAVKDKKFLNNLGQRLVTRVKTRTRVGKGVREPEARPHKLPNLKKQTKKTRRNLKKQGKLTGKGATPAKSGINRSGKTLNSLTRKVVNDEIQLRLDKAGEIVAEDLIKINKDYTFMNISKPEIKFIAEQIEKEILKKIK